MTAIGVVGLGEMGSRLAARLLLAGHEVVVWNRSAEKASSLVERGAVAVETPREAANASEVLITMVSDPTALGCVTEGLDGVAAGARPDLTIIQMSTVGPGAIMRLARLMHPQSRLIDAPVLGSLAEAENGSLVIFAGGDSAQIERIDPLLTTLGSVIRVGGLGAGSAAKLVANATFFSSVCALGEALALGDALGLARATLFEILARTPLSAQAQRRRPVVEAMDFPPRFQLNLALKDARLIHDAAQNGAVPMPIGDAAQAWLAAAVEAGLGGRDYTAVLAKILMSATDNQ